LYQLGRCSGHVFIEGGRDYRNLLDFRLNFYLKSHSLALISSEGSTVTLFANNNYSDQFDFLITRKIDNTRVWILDLNEFKPGQCQQVEDMEGYADFEVCYYFVMGKRSV